jgi:sulfate permease, SulP family
MRPGVATRLAGVIASAMCLLAAAAPFSLLAYVPRAFFGCLLVFISTDLLLAWLWHARHK